MGVQLHAMLDASIVYPAGTHTFWRFLCGRTAATIAPLSTRGLSGVCDMLSE